MSDEYPKAIEVNGLKVTVTDAADEARWLAPPDAAVVAPFPDVLDDPDGVPTADPLDDVTIEMDNPAYNEPAIAPRTSAKKKR